MAVGVRTRIKEGEKDKPTRFYSSKQERTVAKAVGGRTTPNSGATPWVKGDVLTKGANSFLIECKTKTTAADSISIKKEWFEKNRQECLQNGTPHQAVVFNFGPDQENHYIIDEYLFSFLKEKLDELTETL
jgi:hypothetical protein